jgi:hypothetical protein
MGTGGGSGGFTDGFGDGFGNGIIFVGRGVGTTLGIKGMGAILGIGTGTTTCKPKWSERVSGEFPTNPYKFIPPSSSIGSLDGHLPVWGSR